VFLFAIYIFFCIRLFVHFFNTQISFGPILNLFELSRHSYREYSVQSVSE